ncbi:hypothetical protein [Pseudoalteromonas lipolytica]|uniref:Uncharacterized protein n=1 Tax=Pseudoalteromonas lipolytica TaxID=570156 RepID=A0A0P7DU59_9GAMM|nr:hypothetical protein [Pseudoalteromonas lipolytica]KPM82657.1 hypothetical protein AOG27_15225 [Pseudoalteromonas lipolytica]
MSINIPEHIINDSIQSAKDGAFFRDSIRPATEQEIEESFIWLDYLESGRKTNQTTQIEQKDLWDDKLGYRVAAAQAGKARLVKRRKSQTQQKRDENPRSKQSLLAAKASSLDSLYSHALKNLTPEQRSERLGINHDEILCLETGEIKPKQVAEIDKGNFASTVTQADETARAHFQSRNWCDGFRIVCTQNTRASDAPDANTGDRITQTVSSRARGKIIDSGLYMQAVKGGFNAFLTVTLDEKARKKLNEKHLKKASGGKAGDIIKPWYDASGEKLVFEMADNNPIVASGRFSLLKYDFATIGEQLSPFFDKLGKMHKRGFIATGNISKTPKCKKYPWGKVECIGRNDRLYPWGKVQSVGASGRVESDLMHDNERLYSWGIVECIEQCEKRAITNERMEVTAIECEQSATKKPVFDYLWVAEAPAKKHGSKTYEWNGEKHVIECVGEQNYHAHVLMRWNVEPVYFHEWAANIERHWGQGFVTIERIKNAKAAATYLLKALGYMTKGTEGSQGEIRGNRYNISKYARAEAWENCATHEAQHMYGLIQEYMQGLEEKARRRASKQYELKATIGFIEKQKNINKQTFSEKRLHLIEKLEQKLETISEKVTEISNEINGNFARGGVAKFADKTAFLGFMDWAIGVRGWQLKTAFTKLTNPDIDKEIEAEKQEENIVNKLLRKTRQCYDDSISALCDFYSRYERVDDYGISFNE